MNAEKLARPFLSCLVANLHVGSQSGARREYPGDARDNERIATLRRMVDNEMDVPAFVTKPMDQWYDNAPCIAPAILASSSETLSAPGCGRGVTNPKPPPTHDQDERG